MLRPRRLVSLAGALCLVGLVPLTASAANPGNAFSTPQQLTGASGGEPSVATDQAGNVYVVGPQGIPSGVNGGPGVGVWISHDDAKSFDKAKLAGSLLGGGDSDIAIAPDKTKSVFIADLEAAATAVCKSTDKGKTFTSIGPVPSQPCATVPAGQAGPSDDRQYLTAGPDGQTLYLTYHEFVSAQPVAFRSNNGGTDDFTNPCGPLVTDPNIEVNVPTDITGGTLVSKPVTDKRGNLYVMFTTTTQAQNLAALGAAQTSGTFSQVYMAVSTDKCTTFKDYTVYDGSQGGAVTNSVQFGDVFNALAIDGGGNLYAVAAGYVGKTPFAKTTDLFLFASRDGGKTWSKSPIQVGAGGAHMLPAAIGGPQAGQLALGFYHTTNGVRDPNSTQGVWTYSTAESTDATAAAPSFQFADVRPNFVYHRGPICNMGILCTSGRDLLDFTSATIDAQGCPIFAFAANPAGVKNGTFNYATIQTSGCFALARPAVAKSGPPSTPARPGGIPAAPQSTATPAGSGSAPAAPAPAPAPAPAQGSGSLAATGTDPVIAGVALGLLAAGGGLTLARRRARLRG